MLIPGGEEGTAQQRLKRLAWSQFQLPRLAKRHGASVIFTPAPEGYLGPQTIPQVVMVHDLRPISHPERSFQSLYFRSWVPPLLRSCRHVLTNSQFTAREIQRCTGLPDSRITVTPLGYDEQMFKPGTDTPDSMERPYLLHVGQQYPHKNLGRLIHAFAQLADRYPELRLVLVGKSHPSETPLLQGLVQERGLKGRVEFRNYVGYEELPDLYRGALAFVYPSLWEGFGLPVLEAMACGTPVITSYGSATQEVAGESALLVHPLDLSQLVSSIEALLEQPSLRYHLQELGLKEVKAYTWRKNQLITLKAISQFVQA